MDSPARNVVQFPALGSPGLQAVALSDVIDQRLITAIVRGELAPGVKLSEVELAAQLGVSRTPLREALNRLSSEGLLIREANRGVRVAPLDADQAIHFYDCRILLEGRAIELAAPHIGATELIALERCLDEMERIEQLPVNSETRWSWLGVVEQFHDCYRSVCPNPELIKIVRSMANRALRLRVLNIDRPGRMAYSLTQHRRIFEALKRRDADASARALAELLETSKVGIIASIAQNH